MSIYSATPRAHLSERDMPGINVWLALIDERHVHHGAARHLWTDAYLAAFAVCGGHGIVSFDSDFERFRGLEFIHLASAWQPPLHP